VAARGGRAEYRVARRRGQAVAPAERRRAQTCRELGSGGRGRQQVEVERHGCAVCWAGGGGADWRRRTEGNGVKGRCRVQERTAANIFFFLFLMLFPKKIVFLKVYIYYFSIKSKLLFGCLCILLIYLRYNGLLCT
jgi:hypothetical protein